MDIVFLCRKALESTEAFELSSLEDVIALDEEVRKKTQELLQLSKV